MNEAATAPGTEPSFKGQRWTTAVVLLFVAFQCAHFWQMCSRVEDYAPDSSTYQGLADSIRLHGTYRFNFAPHIQYPPGLPVILVAVGALAGTDHLTYLHAIAAMSALALYVTYAFLRREQGEVAAAVGTLLLGASVYYMIYSTAVLNSDVPYLLTSIGALAASHRLEDAGRDGWRWAWAVVFAAAFVASVLLRSAGIALIAGYGLWLIVSTVRQRRIDRGRLLRIGIPLALAGASQVAWWAYVAEARPEALEAWGPGAYTDALWLVDPHRPALGTATIGQLLERILHNAVQHGAHLIEMLGTGWVDQRWYSPLVLLPLLLIAGGCAATIRRRCGPLECYFGAYAVVYALWPYDVGARFVLPVFPIAFLYAWRGVALLWRWTRHDARNAARVIGTGTACLGTVALAAQHLAGPPLTGQARIAPFFWLSAALACAVVAVVFRRPTAEFRWVDAARCRVAGGWLAALLVAALVTRGVTAQTEWTAAYAQSGFEHLIHRPSAEAARWISDHTRPDEVVMAEQFQVVHYLTGRRVVPFPPTIDADRLVGLIDRKDVRYLVVVSSAEGSNVLPREEERLAAIHDATAARMHRVFEGHRVQVLAIDR